jgi:hypothetical protein
MAKSRPKSGGGAQKYPRVSVIIPTFNRASYLPEALQSLFGQTYTDYEVIVVDDGSTDDTADVLARYPDRITYIQTPHAGRSAARNIGLDHACGEYVAFLDSDDTFLPAKLASQVAFMDAHPELDFVYADGFLLDDNGELTPLPPEFVRRLPEAPLQVLLDQLLRGSFILSNTMLLRRRSFEGGLRFDTSLDVLEDWDLWLRMALRGARFAYFDAPVAVYRRHGDCTDMVDPAGHVRARSAICAAVVAGELDAALSPLLQQRFRLWHLGAILRTRSPGLILKALHTIACPEGRVSARGSAALLVALFGIGVRGSRRLATSLELLGRMWICEKGLGTRIQHGLDQRRPAVAPAPVADA